MSIGSLLFCVSMRTSVAVSISSFIMPASKGSPFPGSPSISLSTSAMQIWLPSYAQIIFLRRREGSLNQLRASHFPFASFSIGLLIGLSVPATKYKPINPTTTKTAPATISQCGYCIAESIAYSRRVITSTPFSSAALKTIFSSGSCKSSSVTLNFGSMRHSAPGTGVGRSHSFIT